ncbi:hypothetical protein GCM10028806_08380 [Spirosoma terrae]|uniref:DinB family protein n=1 Tax=Spirosoma terrae TaxID=1968276 RepID=A0A6L9L9I0_9BACT|nr:hypothetical protein [Spirosoma terrae]NDU96022.1 hypothetical protein [Spirosoma terrae]
MSDSDLLAHAIGALAYRFTVAISGCSESFGNYKISSHTRSPTEILNHMYDLVIKTMTMIQEGHFNCPPPEILSFDSEYNRLVEGLQELREIVKTVPIADDVCKRLLQGPILDIATHIGQLAMLNGLNGNKIPKENYYIADIN